MDVELVSVICTIIIAVYLGNRYFSSSPVAKDALAESAKIPGETDSLADKYLISESFPDEDIIKAGQQGCHMSYLLLGDKQWVVGLSKTDGFSAQKWFVTQSFPKEEIASGWSDGYEITG